MELLQSPESADELYLETSVVRWSRPLFQGDIFRDVSLLGSSESNVAVMLITHPCSMRRGPSLRERLAGVRVVEIQKLPFSQWQTGHYDFMPLPGPVADALGMSHPAADFRDIGGVSTCELDLDKRAAVLSETGLLLMQQRYIYHLARFAVDIETLYEHMAPIFIETELQGDWAEAALSHDRADMDRLATIEQAERGFQTFLGYGEGSLRARLKSAQLRASVRREVRQEIGRRFG